MRHSNSQNSEVTTMRSDFTSSPKRLTAVLALALTFGLLIVGCDSGPASSGSQRSANSDSAPVTSAHQSPGQSPESCENVTGTGMISGSILPVSSGPFAGDVVASGPLQGDVTGKLTIVREPGARDQKGNGATFATYHTAILEVDSPSSLAPKFNGAAEGNLNIGLGEEGRRSNRAVVRIDFDGPDPKRGSMNLNGPFDFSDFPSIIKANFEYTGRLCPGS